MNLKNLLCDMREKKMTKVMPILSYPAVSLLSCTVKELLTKSDVQAKAIETIYDRCYESVCFTTMDMSVEAEAFGAHITMHEDAVPTVEGSLVSTMEEAEALPIPPVGAGRTSVFLDAVKKAKPQVDIPLVASVIGPFSLAGRIIDQWEILSILADEPEIVHAVLDKATEFLISYCKALKKAGADGVLVAESLAGLLSPEMMATFSTPYMKKLIDGVQTDDFTVIYHNCGDTVEPCIHEILKVGAGAYHFGNAVNLTKLLPKMPKDVSVLGNLDPVKYLRDGTRETTFKATKDLLDACDSYPNFILSSGCDIPPTAKWENIDAFFDAYMDSYYKDVLL